MKLLVNGNNIVACVSDNSPHYPDAIPIPENFNLDLISSYTYDGTKFNLDISPILIQQTQTNLDTFAQQKGYDNILSVVSYINSSNTTYKNDANTAIYLRDETWTTLNEIINQIKANTIQVTSYSQIANSLPSLVWPV